MQKFNVSNTEIQETNEVFAEFLKQKRIALGLTIREYSQLIYGNLTRHAYLSELENNKRRVTLTTMDFILSKLNSRVFIEEY